MPSFKDDGLNLIISEDLTTTHALPLNIFSGGVTNSENKVYSHGREANIYSKMSQLWQKN
jgi:hypothetical protein